MKTRTFEVELTLFLSEEGLWMRNKGKDVYVVVRAPAKVVAATQGESVPVADKFDESFRAEAVRATQKKTKPSKFGGRDVVMVGDVPIQAEFFGVVVGIQGKDLTWRSSDGYSPVYAYRGDTPVAFVMPMVLSAGQA